MREFLLTQLPVPVVNGNQVKVLCVEPHSTRVGVIPATGTTLHCCDPALNSTWTKLEQLLLTSDPASAPAVFRPQLQCYTPLTHNVHHPLAVINGTSSHHCYAQSDALTLLSLSRVMFCCASHRTALVRSVSSQPTSRSIVAKQRVIVVALPSGALLRWRFFCCARQQRKRHLSGISVVTSSWNVVLEFVLTHVTVFTLQNDSLNDRVYTERIVHLVLHEGETRIVRITNLY